MRRDAAFVLILALAAFGIRTYPAWNSVYNSAGVSFLETDAWYHVRLIENQVHNFPWRVTMDPFAAPGGQFVPVAPLFDTLNSALIVIVHGRDATTAQIERLVALMPPLLGALAIIVAWAVARTMFGRRGGLLAAAFLAVLPGHFMDRTMLGFVDHHALEALLALSVLWAFARGLETPSRRFEVLAGVALGCYLLTWGSGAFLVAIISVWLTVFVLLARSTEDLATPASLAGVSGAVALACVLVFQDAAMHRYGSQVLASAGLVALAATIALLARHSATMTRRRVVLALAGVALVTTAVGVVFMRDVIGQVVVDLTRFAPNPSRMGVLEARPLFLYGGNWNWAQPWSFFRTGFFVGLVALVLFAVRVSQKRRPADLLLLIFSLSTFAATVGQNRFGYYLVVACALLGGWLAAAVLDWGGVPHADNRKPTPGTSLPFAREIAVIAVAGAMFAPNVAPRILLAERAASFPIYWRGAMQWLREHSPAPFNPQASEGDYYLARYAKGSDMTPAYSVMSWWDQGYWTTQQGRRVPVANPTQARAPIAAQFYSARDETIARAIADSQRARYVISDFELPFRRAADGSIMGRFQTILDWTTEHHDDFYEVAYRREGGQWTPVWIFHEPYYRSMAFRLSVLGGRAATPTNTSSAAVFVNRIDENGRRFRELASAQTFPTYEAAARVVSASRGQAVIVGLDPWQSAVPLDALSSFVEVHTVRTPEQKPHESPWVRIFEMR